MSRTSDARTARALLLIVLLVSAARVLSAQETFKVAHVLRGYDLTVEMKSCGEDEPNVCSGAGRVRIFKQGAATAFQVLDLPSIEITRDTVAYSPRVNAKKRGMYAEEYSFIVEDFNFDGREDLAVCNGRNGGYGGPSYNVFLFDPHTRKFVEHRRLSKLTEDGYLGLFFVDPQRKQLVASSKSGCCYHETERYRFVGNRPVLVEKVTEDAHVGEGFVELTTKRLVRGRWVTTVRKEKIKDDHN
jgi:hypothetical protein